MDEALPSPDKLGQAVGAFQEAEIEFVLIGGLAMVAHGSNHLTRDIDLVYLVDTPNLERLAAFLSAIHARVLGRPAHDGFVITAGLLSRVRFLNLDTDLGQVDVMREVPGVDSVENLRQRAVPTDFGGFIVPIASLEDLIAMKLAANRPKDQSHLYELLALKKLLEENK